MHYTIRTRFFWFVSPLAVHETHAFSVLLFSPPPLALSVRDSSALHLADTSLCPLLCRCAILHCRSLLGRLAVLLISLCLAASLPPCNRTLDISHIRPTGCSPLSRFFIAAVLSHPLISYMRLVACSSHPVLPPSCRRALANTTHLLVTSLPHLAVVSSLRCRHSLAQ